MRHSLSFLIVFLIGIIVTPNAFAETANVPNWIKNNAGWWASDLIDDSSFLQGIQYLIKEGIMVIPSTGSSDGSQSDQSVPAWVKNTAGWWADDLISETEFVNSLQYLIKVGIIVVPQAETTLKIPGYPDWLINNPSWQTAREVTNSDFTNFDTSYVKEKVIGSDGFLTLNGIKYKAGSNEKLNSYGLAGPEFSKIKPVNTYRIFAIGGSTTCCALLSFDEFWPAYLQEMFDDEELGVNIEVINAGIVGNNSRGAYALIKDLVLYQPDLIMVYGGLNDAESTFTRKISSSVGASYIDETIENWKSVCKMGNEKGFETIIMLQPIAGTGNRILSDHEFKNFNADTVETFSLYAESLVQLDQYCTVAADFGGVFDYVQNSIFLDKGHVTSLGNQIIAENVFAISLPIVSSKVDPSYEAKTEFSTHHYTSNSSQFVIYAAGADFSGRNFDGLDLSDAIFDRAGLSNVSFKNAKLDGVRFAFANLDGTSLSGHDLTNSNLGGVDLSGKDLTGTILRGANLSHANLSGQNLSGKDLTGTVLTGADLSYANLTGVDLSGKDLSNANLTGIDLSGKDLTDTILTGADLSNTNLTSVDLLGKDLTRTILAETNPITLDLTRQDLTGINLTGMNLDGVDLAGKNLTNAILIGADLSGKDLTGTNLTGAKLISADLSDMDLTSTILTKADLTSADLSNTNLSGADLTECILKYAILSNTNLSHTNLTEAELSYSVLLNTDIRNADLSSAIAEGVNFTEIKHKSWDGTTLPSKLTFSNLEGMDFSGQNLTLTWLPATKLVGANFSNDVILHGTFFREADLTNANFEGANLSPKTTYSMLFENMAYLVDPDYLWKSGGAAANMKSEGATESRILGKALTGYDTVDVHETEVRGDDLFATYFLLVSFRDANLEGANFANTSLQNVSFVNANLSNADLSGSDLRGSLLINADLSGANLNGALLDGAVLSCKNHAICN